MPERASPGESVTVTAPVYQPLRPAVPAMLDAVEGAVRSILMPATPAEALLPALSATPAEAPRLLPSPVITEWAGSVVGSMPDRASTAVQVMVTSSLYQPAAFGAVVAAPPSVGAV